MLAQLWSEGYILDWSGLGLTFAGAALAAFAIRPPNRRSAAGETDALRTSHTFAIVQSKQIKTGLAILAFGCLLQSVGTFQAALPLFAR
jgi:hypothetical protein